MKDKCSILDKYSSGKITRKQASLMLNVCTKTVSNMKQTYLKEGINAFFHGNTGRVPSNKISKNKEMKIINLYKNKFISFNFTHF
jgi:transposase